MAREIELQASLQHPSIVQIYAAFEDNEGIYVVQEFALGGDLYAQLAQAGGYLAEDQVACEVMVPVLAALGFMHDKVSMPNPIVTPIAWQDQHAIPYDRPICMTRSAYQPCGKPIFMARSACQTLCSP